LPLFQKDTRQVRSERRTNYNCEPLASRCERTVMRYPLSVPQNGAEVCAVKRDVCCQCAVSVQGLKTQESQQRQGLGLMCAVCAVFFFRFRILKLEIKTICKK